MKSFSEHLIPADASLLEALDRLNSLSGRAPMVLFAENSDGTMAGTLTDGDIRRALLAGTPVDANISVALNKNFRHFSPNHADDMSRTRNFRAEGILLVPRLDSEGRIAEVVDLRHTTAMLPLSAILMAGGKGERLRPMTLSTPKPLLRIEGKAIIDYNIEALAAVGITDIHVTTRYLADQIEDHFAGEIAGVKIACHREDIPLGTIGSATLVPLGAEGDTLVMNSDLLTTIDYEELYLRHRDAGADITIAVVPYQVSVPYAILALDGKTVTGLEEKPTYSYYANAGIYIFSNRVLHTLVPGVRTDATDLIESTISAGGKVTYYPIKGTWIDVGSPVDFRQASELMKHHKSFKHSGMPKPLKD